jgi:hypothetical protein
LNSNVIAANLRLIFTNPTPILHLPPTLISPLQEYKFLNKLTTFPHKRCKTLLNPHNDEIIAARVSHKIPYSKNTSILYSQAIRHCYTELYNLNYFRCGGRYAERFKNFTSKKRLNSLHIREGLMWFQPLKCVAGGFMLMHNMYWMYMCFTMLKFNVRLRNIVEIISRWSDDGLSFMEL